MGPAGSVLYLDGGVVVVSSANIELVGFTTATYTGDLGGLPGAAAKCRVDFPGSFLCSVADYDRANTTAAPPTAAGAWLDYNRTANGTRSINACANGSTPWNYAANPYSAYGPYVTGVGYAGTTLCSQSKHLTCCRTAAANTFRGFTTAVFNGDLGGLPGATAKCRAEFPGSTLCTIAEYDRANVTAVPPDNAGAWIDYNRADDGTRSINACANGSTPWNYAANPYSAYGAFVTAVGYAGTVLCSQSKHLACCGP